ncbi:hypothetical protein CR513_54184, partial [Mucuna pruriens]
MDLGPKVMEYQSKSAQLPFSNFPLVDDVAQRPNLVKGKETVKGGSKEEDLKWELEKRAREEVDKERKITEQMAKCVKIEEEIRLRTEE